MRNFTISIIGGFVVNNLMAAAVALAILNPLVNPSFDGTVRSMEDGLNLPSLLGGYLLLTLIMTWLYRKINWKHNWLINGTILGGIAGGIIFVSGHLIVAGWSIIPAQPMLISGILDSLATIATGIFIAFIYRNENN